MFLGLEALLHPHDRALLGLRVPNIDATGWVADVGMASVWTTKHAEGAPDPRVSRPLPVADRDAYYLMSAPSADLLGDIDVFAVRAQWALAAGQPLSAACAPTTWAAGTAAGDPLALAGVRVRQPPGLPPGRRPHHLGSGVVAGLGPPHRPLQRRLRGRRRRLPVGTLTARPAVWPETPTCSACSWPGPSHCSRLSWPPGRDPEQRSWIRRRMQPPSQPCSQGQLRAAPGDHTNASDLDT